MPWLPKKNVVVPIDFSEESLDALATARELVADASSLHLVHVLPYLEVTEPGVIWEAIDDASRRKHAEDALRERIGADFPGAKIFIAFGDPGREIAEYAQTSGAELIVLPSHGRTGLSRLLIGSVAERVVRLAHCPVLVLRQ
jgi:nucleotide-binding universal stress UspA family protein